MKMHKEEYEKLLVRFATELAEVGVTPNQLELIRDTLLRAPNVASANQSETVADFHYKHNGYMIQAKKTIEIMVKKCK
tara:strand:+ start:188 stop:421 length:234 start_codon:yes stop_codon:yes gene_type:complete